MVNLRLCKTGFKIRDWDFKKLIRTSEMQNHPKVRVRDPWQTLPRFRDGAKIFQDGFELADLKESWRSFANVILMP